MYRCLAVAALGLAFLAMPARAQRGGHGGGGFGGHAGGFASHGSGFASRGPSTMSRGFSSFQRGGNWATGPSWRGSYNGYRNNFSPYRSGRYGRGWGYGYPWWGPYGGWGWGDDYDYPDYSQQSYPPDDDSAGYDPSGAMQTQAELDRLHAEVDRLHQDRNRIPQPPTLTQSNPVQPTELVFRDKHVEQVQNYAIMGSALYDLTDGHRRKIPLADLDLIATAKQNEDRGIDFQVPGRAQAN